MLNGVHTRTIDLLKTGDILSITLPVDKEEQTNAVEPLPYPLKVFYEDEDLLIVNKPAGLPLHPSHNHQGDTLANAVAYHLQQQGKSSVFRSIGRLDRGTSGIVVCGLNRFVTGILNGNIYKEYMAVCDGLYEGEGIIDRPIYRPDPIKTYRTVDERGEFALTEWKAISHYDNKTLLRIHLQTGRTHQIRVHFASLGTPLVGDTMYGTPRDDISRQALHCCYCKFTHPVTKEIIEIESPLPEDIAQFVK
jgi:23S rRNA pseudouridine1911/1915/1917 synthase